MPDVCCDNGGGARAAAAHLLDVAGRRHPLLVAGPADNSDAAEREAAFRAALAERGADLLPERVVRAGFERESAYRQVLAALARHPDTDAVFAANDEMALGAVDALETAGWAVPERVSVVGFDDTPASATGAVPLTSVDQQLEEQGRQVAALVLAMLPGAEVPLRTRTGCRLVVRESSGAATGRDAGSGSTDDRTTALSGALRAAREEVVVVRQLLGAGRALRGALTDDDLVRELDAWLPRLSVGRAFLAHVHEGRARLVHHWDGARLPARGGPDHPDHSDHPDHPDHPVAELLPEALQEELSRGLLVVRQLPLGDGRAALLMYDQHPLDRHTSEALPQDVAHALDAVRRSRDARDRSVELEQQVADRTTQLHAEVLQRRAAQDELSRANSQLRRALLVDGLTGLVNRPGLDAALDRAWAVHERTGDPLSVLIIDVDHFKAYNDAAGHLAGDRCLREVAARLAAAVRGPEDTVARYGGEEFAVVLPSTGAHRALQVADRLLASVRSARLVHPGLEAGATVSVSIGVASTSTSGGAAGPRDPQELLEAADGALYAAKRAGRDRLELAEPAAGAPSTPG